jgi:hypothetical protein
MSQRHELDDEITLVRIGPSASVEDGISDFEDEEVTGVFNRPDLPDLPVLDIDWSRVSSGDRPKGPPPIEVEVPEPVYDPSIPDPFERDASRNGTVSGWEDTIPREDPV